MRLSFSSSCCNSASSLALFPAARLRQHKGRWARMDSRSRRKEKLVAILGATGAGKSRLSVDIGCRFASEIINADKIQVYQGLDITTNKISMAERRGVPHHLLGEFDSNYGELSASDFRSFAGSVIKEISARKKLPIIAGGSNSFIHALLSDRYEPEIITPELRYNCCFLWLDVQLPVLYEYLSKRVEDMLDMGMFPELAEFYDPVSSSVLPRLGLRKAIGVPEFDRFFRRYPPEYNNFRSARPEGDLARRVYFEEAVDAIKDNTCQLAKKQVQKILRLRSAGWNLTRMDATEVFRLALENESERAMEVWRKDVMEPSVKIVKRFLDDAAVSPC